MKIETGTMQFAHRAMRSTMWQHVEEAVEEAKEQNKELGQLKLELKKAAADLANANAKLVEAKAEGEKK
ncbi:MAG: hypothetical protein LBI69_03390 [Puniceicoccales bacterium]|jgi:hypothetical protein|nr:hypothetical protein [Puniceicoccales bacterium]